MIRIDRPPGVDQLEPFVEAGVLGATEIEVVTTLARVVGESDPDVLLGAALAVRGPLFGHVCVDLTTVASSVVVERTDPEPLAELHWPEPGPWLVALAASALVRSAARDDTADEVSRPLVLDGDRLYLDRYWRYEQSLLRHISDRSGARDARQVADRLEQARPALDRLFGPIDPAKPDRQRLAAEAAITGRFTVIAGGPGTGKTRTVARLLAVLEELALDADHPLDVRLAAPTGKAAARMTEAIVGQVGEAAVSEAVRARLLAAEAVTVHRLLGSNGRGGFRHDRHDPLPADVVVIDETSMVSLPLMARLLDGVRPDAQVVLVGDPSQLASVEAGAVLGDLIGSTTDAPMSAPPHSWSPVSASSGPVPAIDLVVLDHIHRFAAGSPIAQLSDRIRRGDADAVIALLDRTDAPDSPDPHTLRWIDPGDRAASTALGDEVVDHARRVVTAARQGQADAALEELTQLAVLSATRLGPSGVVAWNQLVEHRLGAEPAFDLAPTWYPGRPIIVTANDYLNGVSNGDVGVTVVHDRPQVAFRSGDGIRLLDPSRLDRIETWWAMTIHKSQGSEFDHVVVVLPPPPSPILTRELLYTAVTRAATRVTVLASESSIRAAVDRPVSRASGLAARLARPLAAANAPPVGPPDDQRSLTVPDAPPDDGPLTLF